MQTNTNAAHNRFFSLIVMMYSLYAHMYSLYACIYVYILENATKALCRYRATQDDQKMCFCKHL